MTQQEAIQDLAQMVRELALALRHVCAADIAYVPHVAALERIASQARDIDQTVGDE